MAGTRQLPNDPLQLDVRPLPDLRVRGWLHRGRERTAWPAGAHPAVEVAWVERGAVGYDLGGRALAVEAGAVVVVPPGVEHATRIEPGTRAGSIWVGVDLIGEIDDAIGAGRTRLVAGLSARPDRTQRIGRLLLEEVSEASRGRSIAAEALAEALVVEVLRGAPSEVRTSPAKDVRIGVAIDLIESRYADALTIEQLARAAGMSRFHFSRRFREVTGKSPYQYLLFTRIARAAELLRVGRATVTEVALEVGFNDLGRFASAFKRQMSCGPSAFARARAA